MATIKKNAEITWFETTFQWGEYLVPPSIKMEFRVDADVETIRIISTNKKNIGIALERTIRDFIRDAKNGIINTNGVGNGKLQGKISEVSDETT